MQLTYNEFRACVQIAVSRFTSNWLNDQQNDAVSAPPLPPVFIVAGPGTGKTTVLALRVLKHIFVDDFPPESIIATTFTRKAANELRSRILSWGVATQNEALSQAQTTNNQQRVTWLQSLDINKVKTGTLDALAQEMIADDRQTGEITPTVIESFMAQGLLRKHVMFQNGWHRNPLLEGHLNTFAEIDDFAKKLKVCHSFADRILHDGVDLLAYSNQGQGHQILTDIINNYHNYLKTNQLMDFACLEQDILQRLQSGRLTTITQNLRALLVDEFQDTNYLQEQIYYNFCRRTNAAFTVVGDDDQSIYRFRGATVEIFADFENRIQTALGHNWNPRRFDLINNYRSSERIVEFFNHFISSDSAFHSARVSSKIPCLPSAIWATNPNQNIPILGIFRTDVQALANDICTFLHDIFRGSGRIITVSGGLQYTIQANPNGDFGDAVLLARTVQERTKVRNLNQNSRERLPFFIRQIMKNNYGVEVFNPRGRDLATIPEVMQCLGIMLDCIDPNARVQGSITTIKPTTIQTFNNWRRSAQQFVLSNPHPGGLQKFVTDWGARQWSNKAKEWPLLELLFTVITWITLFQKNPEGQIYLETIARTIQEASQVANYGCIIMNEGTSNDDNSVKHAIREVFEPIAEGDVEVDEEIMPYVPKTVFPIMTIHQAKGLEFPLAIIDVGSDFSRNHPKQRQFRYPEEGGEVHLTEDQIANFSPVGQARQQRTAIDRAFDDIKRLFFVAKSRPQCVLLLVGLTSQLRQSSPIPSVTTGDLRVGGRTYQFIPAQNWTPNAPANVIALI